MFRSDRFAALRGLAVLLAVAMLFVLLAAACDGDGDEGETPQAGETPAADGAGLQELEALAAAATDGIVAKITYRVTTQANGESIEQEWVLVQRPPDARFEIAGTEGGEEFRTIIISAGGKSYLCSSVVGEESCLESETGGAEAQTALSTALLDVPQELAEGAEDVDLAETSQRSIAGVDATCFMVRSGLADLGEGEVCFSDAGLLLYLRSEVGGTSTVFEATSVSTDVTDADFEPPFPVEEFELPESDIPPPP